LKGNKEMTIISRGIRGKRSPNTVLSVSSILWRVEATRDFSSVFWELQNDECLLFWELFAEKELPASSFLSGSYRTCMGVVS